MNWDVNMLLILKDTQEGGQKLKVFFFWEGGITVLVPTPHTVFISSKGGFLGKGGNSPHPSPPLNEATLFTGHTAHSAVMGNIARQAMIRLFCF